MLLNKGRVSLSLIGRLAALAIFGAATPGCVYTGASLAGDLEGLAHEGNKAAQIVSIPVSPDAPEMDGQRTDMAIERYRTDQIKQPDRSSGIGQISGGAGGGQ